VLLELGDLVLVSDGDPFRAFLAGCLKRVELLGKLFDVAPRRHAPHAELVRELGHDLQRADADRAGTSKDAEVFHRVSLFVLSPARRSELYPSPPGKPSAPRLITARSGVSSKRKGLPH
jgi:hypothetical protein